MNQTELNPQQPQTPQPYYYQMPPVEDEIDLFELFASLFAQWRLIIGITIIGVLISISVALITPKIYETSASVRTPLTSQIAAINENGYTKFTAQRLFKRYYDQVKSKQNLKNHLLQTSAIPRLVPNIDEADIDKTVAALMEQFNVTILEPEAPKGEVVKFPELFQVSLSATAEPETVAVLNHYLQHIEEIILKDIGDEGVVEVTLRSNNLNRDIDLLRTGAKRSRELLIEKLMIQNQEKIDLLQQQVELLEEKAGNEKRNRVIKLEEARDIARALNIMEPTTIDLLAQASEKVPGKSSTQVSISSNSNRLDFLMGTQYLDSRIKLLQSRESDLPYVTEIPELLRKIAALKNDRKIAALKSRESDDPFIDSLPGKLNALDKLGRITFEFGDASLYQIDRAAAVDGVAEKPNRKLIVVLGTLLSGMLALFIALIVATIKKRALRQES